MASKPNRQWIIREGALSLGVNDAQDFILAADPEDTWTFRGRVLRVLLNLDPWGDALVVAPEANWLGVGLIRSSPDVPLGNFNAMQQAKADSQWLYRGIQRLNNVVGPYTGPIDMNTGCYFFDWPIHGGKGTNVMKDVDIRLNFGTRLVSGSVELAWRALFLVVSD